MLPEPFLIRDDTPEHGEIYTLNSQSGSFLAAKHRDWHVRLGI